MTQRPGRTWVDFLIRSLAVAAMLGLYCVGTLSVSGLALTAATTAAEAQRGRGRSGGRGRGGFSRGGRGRGGWGRGHWARGRGRGHRGSGHGGVIRGTAPQRPDFGRPSTWGGGYRSDGPGGSGQYRTQDAGGSAAPRTQDTGNGSAATRSSDRQPGPPARTTSSAARDERIFLCARMSDKERAAMPCCTPPYEIACR
jgi:hypothetical protein